MYGLSAETKKEMALVERWLLGYVRVWIRVRVRVRVGLRVRLRGEVRVRLRVEIKNPSEHLPPLSRLTVRLFFFRLMIIY